MAKDDGASNAEGIDRRSPESELAAREHLEAILQALESDSDVPLVAMALLDGLKGAEAAEAAGLDAKKFDAARKRLVRTLTKLEVGGILK